MMAGPENVALPDVGTLATRVGASLDTAVREAAAASSRPCSTFIVGAGLAGCVGWDGVPGCDGVPG